jgi:hypothetical protein
MFIEDDTARQADILEKLDAREQRFVKNHFRVSDVVTTWYAIESPNDCLTTTATVKSNLLEKTAAF